MADTSELEGLDPYQLQDVESARIAAWVQTLDEEALALPSACEGWSRRDVLAHLLATEEYHRACLDGTVAELMQRLMSTGATSLDQINALGVAAHEDEPTDEVLVSWEEQNARSRAGFRAADGKDIDSSIGAYPGRAQAFHVAWELAVHADDMDAPVRDDESDARAEWMAAVSRFALTEVKGDISVDRRGEDYIVRRGETEAIFDRAAFIAGVSGRVEPGHLSEADAELLSLGY